MSLRQALSNPSTMKKTIILAALAAVGMTTSIIAAEIPAPSTQTDVTYAKDIKPIFDQSCVKCHTGDRAKARLKMDSLAGIMKGTKMGPILKAGDSTNSWIVKIAAHAVKDEKALMPPLNNKANIGPLTTNQIALIRAWIDQGAK